MACASGTCWIAASIKFVCAGAGGLFFTAAAAWTGQWRQWMGWWSLTSDAALFVRCFCEDARNTVVKSGLNHVILTSLARVIIARCSCCIDKGRGGRLRPQAISRRRQERGLARQRRSLHPHPQSILHPSQTTHPPPAKARRRHRVSTTTNGTLTLILCSQLSWACCLSFTTAIAAADSTTTNTH